MRKMLIGFAGLVLGASLAAAHGQEPKLVTCNTGLTFLADIYTDRVLMGEGYIVTGADGPPVSSCCAGFSSPREADPLQPRRVRMAA
jgi:hypothetical protein